AKTNSRLQLTWVSGVTTLNRLQPIWVRLDKSKLGAPVNMGQHGQNHQLPAIQNQQGPADMGQLGQGPGFRDHLFNQQQAPLGMVQGMQQGQPATGDHTQNVRGFQQTMVQGAGLLNMGQQISFRHATNRSRPIPPPIRRHTQSNRYGADWKSTGNASKTFKCGKPDN
ncbi:unnamed protein product, partial [Owenia fusiformis]